jgi:hypothetical protein
MFYIFLLYKIDIHLNDRGAGIDYGDGGDRSYPGRHLRHHNKDSSLDVNVTNALEFTPSGPLDVNATITNSSLDVNVTNALEFTPSGPLDVNVTNTDTQLTQYEDAFGRLRISDQYTLADYKHVYFSDDNYIDVLSGGGVVTYNQNQSCVVMGVVGNGDSAIHQTKLYHHYQPGKSQFIKSSFVFGAPVANVIKRTGLFDDTEGIYLEMNGLDLSWNIRSVNLNQTAPRNTWLDPMDGTGPSGVTLNFANTQLIFIDFQWLGVGQVRCGFVHDGKNYIVKIFYNSNTFDHPYLRNPSLPIRCEITSSGGSSSMKQICTTAISEGGYEEVGRDFDASSGHIGRSCPQGGTRYPILAIRLKNSFKGLPNRVSVRLSNVSAFALSNNVLWEIWRLPTAASLTGTVNWTDINTGSAVEYSVHPTGINTTSCLLITSGYISAESSNKGNSPISLPNPTKSRQLLLSQNFASNDSEVFVLVFTPLGTSNNSGVLGFGSLQWREVY